MTTTATHPRVNKYAGRCFTCQQHVDAQAGRIERIAGDWRVFHLDGTCPAPPMPADGPGRTARFTPATRAPVGIYRHDGVIYVVRESRGQKDIQPASDRRRYAEKMVLCTSGRLTKTGEAVEYDWEYDRGAVYELTEAMRVPLDDEEIAKLMIATGKCIICKHPLWAKKTMQRARDTGIMIGDVCKGSFAPATTTEAA